LCRFTAVLTAVHISVIIKVVLDSGFVNPTGARFDDTNPARAGAGFMISFVKLLKVDGYLKSACDMPLVERNRN